MAHYPTMTHADICALPVQDIAASNCVLFIWVTFPKLKEGLEVIDAWDLNIKPLDFHGIKQTKTAGYFLALEATQNQIVRFVLWPPVAA